MVYVSVLCDDRFDTDLTYQIEGEEVETSACVCEKCAKYSECQGWAEIFGRCQTEKL